MPDLQPKTHALAYRIWAYCEPLGWNVTIEDVAEALDVKEPRVLHVSKVKGWQTRFRKGKKYRPNRCPPITKNSDTFQRLTRENSPWD
jgi:hypothetical protein